MLKRLRTITALTLGVTTLLSADPSSAELQCGYLWNKDDAYCSVDGVQIRPPDNGFNYKVFHCLKPRTAAEKIVACTNALQDRQVSPREALYVQSERADAYLKDGQFDPALSDWNELIQKDPTAERFKKRGDVFLEKEDFGPAIQDYSEAIKREVSNSEYHAARGEAYAKLQDWKNAIADLRGAVRLDPKNPDYQFLLAVSYRESGDYASAIDVFTSVIETAPDAVAYLQRALAHAFAKEFDEAIADASQAIDLEPSRHTAWYTRGLFFFSRAKARFVPYLASNDLDRSTEDLGEAIRLDPADPFSYTVRAKVYETMGKVVEAIEDWQKVLELNSEHQEAQEALSRLRSRTEP